MKKSVVTLLAVAALGAVVPVFAEETAKQASSETVTYSPNAPEGKLQAVPNTAPVVEEKEAVTFETSKGTPATVTPAPVADPAAAAQGNHEAHPGYAPVAEEKPVATPEMIAAAKPAPKTVAPAATKTAAKALPKTSAVK